MLRQLRKRKTMKRILWALVILIIPPFTFWGIGSAMRSRDKGPSYAGKVFDKKVSFEEYGNALEAVKTQALMIYGKNLNEIAGQLDLQKQAWERIILLKEAKKNRIKVSDDEVVSMIARFPFFQSNGKFDQRAYDLILNQVFRIDARQFEEEMREAVKISKLRDYVTKGIIVTDADALHEFKKENEKIEIAYILISPKDFVKDAVIDEKELKKYYEENTESFRVGEQVNVEYIGFEFSDYEKAVQVTEDQIKGYYDKHKDEFDPKKEFKDLKDPIKEGLIKDSAKEKALEAAEKIDYALAGKEKSFEDTAKANSLPIKETGLFEKEGFIPQIGYFPEIQERAFKLDVGEQSGLIKSKSGFAKGYYIIRLKAKKPPYIPSYAEAKEKIEKILKQQKAFGIASAEADRLQKNIADLMKSKNVKFEDAAAEVKHPAKRSAPFTRNGYIEGLGVAEELGDNILQENPVTGQISGVLKTRTGFCIISILNIAPADEEIFKKDKEELLKKTLEAKKMHAVNEWYNKLMDAANLQNNVPPEK